ARPEVRSFAIGMPGTDLFPADDMAEAARRVLRDDPRALQYGLPSRALKARVVELLRLRGVEAREEEVFLTTGSQQAMDLLARLLLDPGGTVALEETVYDGIQIAVRPLVPRVLTVPTSPEHGIDVDGLEALLEEGERPAFLYLVPEGHNPMGGSLPAERRLRLVELARRYRLPILEDDAYGLLRYDRDAAPPLRALDSRWVFYLGSFSKILAPAFRVGWIVAPEELVSRLSIVKHATDLDTATFAQRALAAYLEAGHLPAHLTRIRAAYRERRDAMLDALSKEMPPGVRWHPPEAGIFVWAWLAPGADATAILREAIRREAVAFCPGSAFAVAGARHADHCLRLSFADAAPAEIREGIARLGRVLRSVLSTEGTAATG
ncbi:MAG TPA: PLP-dependent aminotransferase family protein, partial [Thermoanaerobaculia bacterium]|nr:PLP-dependent aminotransferase family protein [Thermoanaerobaculia bacterium]